MPLFIDRLPFASWIDRTRTPPRTHRFVVLPVVLSEPNLPRAPTNVAARDWVLDTGNRAAAFAWRKHLLDAGLDPDLNRIPGRMNITNALGGTKIVPVRMADLWLVSNVPTPHGFRWRMELDPGIALHDVPALPDPQFHRPLIGLRALRRAGLRVEIDFAADVVSVWTP